MGKSYAIKRNKRKMKNLNKIGQYIAASAGAALLASFATLATPKTASAATLSKNVDGEWVSTNAEEAVDKILNLDIDGKLYDVTLSKMTVRDMLVSSNMASNMGVDAQVAANKIMEALGTGFKTSWGDQFLLVSDIVSGSDNSDYMYDFNNTYDLNFWWDLSGRPLDRDDLAYATRETLRWYSSYSNVVQFSEADTSASTPEPSLIFGFITLGGLMLGGKRKTNG